MTSNRTLGPNRFRIGTDLWMVRCMPLLTTIALSVSMDTVWSSTTKDGTLASGWERQGLRMQLVGPFSSASKYKCAKLTLPTPATRALEFPEVVARARRVAPKWVASPSYPGSSLLSGSPWAPSTWRKSCLLVSYKPLARSAFEISGVQLKKRRTRAQLAARGNLVPGCSALTRQSLEPINGDDRLLIYGLTRGRPAARTVGRFPRRPRRDGRRVSRLSRGHSWPAVPALAPGVRLRGAAHNFRRAGSEEKRR